MRIVSALYHDTYPFDAVLENIDSVGCVDNPDELLSGDILIVHGGEDISPSLYGHGRSSKGYGSVEPSTRDTMEWNLMKRAKELEIPIIGICRGAQMLCALEGGYLIQDVNGHSGHHSVKTFDGKEFYVNSIHHQMMVPVGQHKVVAWSEPRSHTYNFMLNGQEVIKSEYPQQNMGDPEFIHFPSGFAIQWHPEMMAIGTPATNYISNYINSCLMEVV